MGNLSTDVIRREEAHVCVHERRHVGIGGGAPWRRLVRDAIVDPTCVEVGALGGGLRGRERDGRLHVGPGRGQGDRRLLFLVGDGLRRDRSWSADTVRVVPVQSVVVAGLLRGARLTLTAAAIETAAQTAAEIAPGEYAAAEEQGFAPCGRDHEVSVHIFLAELLSDVEAERAVVVVDVALRGVYEDGVGPVDLLELVHGFRVVGVLVRVVLECQLAVRLLHVIRRGRLRQGQDLVQAVAGRRQFPPVHPRRLKGC